MENARLAMIVAMAANRVIGINNQLPWYLPEDLKYFKRVTLGKPVIMGRKTFASIGKPLPGRDNIVISRSPPESDAVHWVDSIDAALERADQLALVNGNEEVMVIGGSQIYGAALPHVQRLYITEVLADVEGDAFFPEFDRSEWQVRSSEFFPASEPNPYDYRFVVLDRPD